MNPPAVPSRIRAMTPPIREPPSPRPIVAYQGIGSGPGRARRARPPTMNPQTIRPMMKKSTRPLRPQLVPGVSARRVATGRVRCCADPAGATRLATHRLGHEHPERAPDAVPLRKEVPTQVTSGLRLFHNERMRPRVRILPHRGHLPRDAN